MIDIERNIERKIILNDAVIGILIGIVPSFFLSSFSGIYALILLIIFIATKRKIFLWAFLASLIFFLMFIIYEFLEPYNSFIDNLIGKILT